ncbi:MAG TPA: hypothetical protein VF556_07695 [Pyrinomonadaceae bacterium]|jgi:hypothetical protein
MKYADLKNKLIKIFRAFQKALANIFFKFSQCYQHNIAKPKAENHLERTAEGCEQAKLNLVKFFKNCDAADSYSNGKLIDECYRSVDEQFEIDTREAALFTTLLERFQKSIGLEITPNGITVDDSILDEQWLEEVSSDDL